MAGVCLFWFVWGVFCLLWVGGVGGGSSEAEGLVWRKPRGLFFLLFLGLSEWWMFAIFAVCFLGLGVIVL